MLCRNGHDKTQVGMRKNGQCAECDRSGKVRRHRLKRGIPLTAPKYVRPRYDKTDPNYQRYRGWRARYKMAPGEYEAKLAEQGGACALCDQPPAAGRVLHVDHCHASGRRRSLLCLKCNAGIGQLGDDPQRLRRAADYLDRWKESV